MKFRVLRAFHHQSSVAGALPEMQHGAGGVVELNAEHDDTRALVDGGRIECDDDAVMAASAARLEAKRAPKRVAAAAHRSSEIAKLEKKLESLRSGPSAGPVASSTPEEGGESPKPKRSGRKSTPEEGGE